MRNSKSRVKFQLNQATRKHTSNNKNMTVQQQAPLGSLINIYYLSKLQKIENREQQWRRSCAVGGVRQAKMLIRSKINAVMPEMTNSKRNWTEDGT